MSNTKWPAGHVIASVLWTAAVALCIASMFVPCRFGALGVLAAAAAATVQVRYWIEQYLLRETMAFDLGREAGLRRIR